MKQHNLEGEPRPYLIEYSDRLEKFILIEKSGYTIINN